jgi:hypothetical protein
MANKKIYLGMSVMILAFGLFLTGCDEPNPGTDGYTFEFKVYFMDTGGDDLTVKKIQFIDSYEKNGRVLKTENVSLSSGQTSSAYRVSGFSIKDASDGKNYFYVNLILSDNSEYGGRGKAIDNAKILGTFWCGGIIEYVSFEAGDW